MTFFEDIRPLKGSTGLVDWRLNGRLSDMILKGRLSGHFSESLLLPAQGRMSASEIFLFGLGKSSEMDELKLEEGFQILIDKLGLLKSRDVIVSVGDFASDFMGWRTLLRNFMTALSQRHKQDVQVVCAEDSRWISEARKRNMDFGPDVSLSYA